MREYGVSPVGGGSIQSVDIKFRSSGIILQYFDSDVAGLLITRARDRGSAGFAWNFPGFFSI